MSSVSGKDADFDISASSPTQCSDGWKHSSRALSEESLEPDGYETGYINQTVNEESSDTNNELESAAEDLGKSTLGSIPSKSSDDEDKDENVITTTPVVLIPAIKGSREKHGLSLKKTSVSWAADVYDPPPSIASHTRNKKQQQQQKSKSKDSHKKNGKKGNKGKDNSNSSRSGKDKKQASRKHSREKFDWVTQMPIVAASS